jgi:hypothetical protein
MSQENVEVAVNQFEGTNARDFAGVADSWAEDVNLVLQIELWAEEDREAALDAAGLRE